MCRVLCFSFFAFSVYIILMIMQDHAAILEKDIFATWSKAPQIIFIRFRIPPS